MLSAKQNSKVLLSSEACRLNLLLLVAGRLVSDLGSAIFRFGLSLYILDITGSAGAFSMILGFSLFPQAVVNLIAGVFVDQHNKKKILIVCDVVSGLSVLIFMYLFKNYPANLLLFIIYVALLGGVQALLQLTLNASIPVIVNDSQIEKANSLFQCVGAVVNIAGPAIGAVAYKTIGLTNIFWIDGISFLIAATLKIFLTYNKQNQDNKVNSYLEGMADILAYIKTQAGIRFLMIALICINFVFLPLINLVLPFVCRSKLHLSEIQLATVQGAWAVGAIVGALIISLWRRPLSCFFKKAFVMMQCQAVFILLWIFPCLPWALWQNKENTTLGFSGLMIVAGLLNAVINITTFTFFQLRIPENIRARFFGIMTSASLMASPIGMWFFGILLQRAEWPSITTFAGILLFAIALLAHRDKRFHEMNL